MATIDQSRTQSKTGTGDPPPPPPPNVGLQFNVVVTNASGKIAYELKPTDTKSGNYLKGPNKQTIDFPNGPDWYDVTFHVVDTDSSQKIVFNTAQPICAKIGSGCPANGSGINTNNQITVQDSKEKKLTLQNCNQEVNSISYTLFFMDEKTKQPIDPPYDPVMDNGGGGRGLI